MSEDQFSFSVGVVLMTILLLLIVYSYATNSECIPPDADIISVSESLLYYEIDGDVETTYSRELCELE